jgi:hypothetical protein
MEDYLKFRKMITPTIIQILYWIGTGLAIIFALFEVFSGVTAQFGGGARVLRGLGWLVFGPIGVRIACELIMLFFRMNDTLSEIAAAGKKKK